MGTLKNDVQTILSKQSWKAFIDWADPDYAFFNEKNYLQIWASIVKASFGNFACPNLSIGRPASKSLQSLTFKTILIVSTFVCWVDVVSGVHVVSVIPCAHVMSSYVMLCYVVIRIEIHSVFIQMQIRTLQFVLSLKRKTEIEERNWRDMLQNVTWKYFPLENKSRDLQAFMCMQFYNKISKHVRIIRIEKKTV